jgi:hypothetical protein
MFHHYEMPQARFSTICKDFSVSFYNQQTFSPLFFITKRDNFLLQFGFGKIKKKKTFNICLDRLSQDCEHQLDIIISCDGIFIDNIKQSSPSDEE